jgi:hypothetical protein
MERWDTYPRTKKFSRRRTCQPTISLLKSSFAGLAFRYFQGESKFPQMKPEVAYYQAIRRALGFEPGELFLWDDYPKNVEVARSCGWEGEVYSGFEVFAT